MRKGTLGPIKSRISRITLSCLGCCAQTWKITRQILFSGKSVTNFRTVPIVSGTVSISKEETSRFTSIVSAEDRPKSSNVSDGLCKMFPFSDSCYCFFNLAEGLVGEQIISLRLHEKEPFWPASSLCNAFYSRR